MTGAILPADVEAFLAHVQECFGLAIDVPQLARLTELLEARLHATGCRRASEYLAVHWSTDRRHQEERALAEALTIGETYFFRHPEHFTVFNKQIAADAEARGRKLAILSAGCASGEEPYSLAIALREAFGDRAGEVASIDALDVNPTALAKAHGGRYTRWSLRGTPSELQQRYFEAGRQGFVLAPGIREMVRFTQGNLATDESAVWTPGRYDVIFCRNVMIYFSPEAMRLLVERLARALAPGGYLFLGASETLRGLSTDFQLRNTHGTFYYERGNRPCELPRAATRAPATPPDGAWFDAIQAASSRIERLANGRSRDRVEPAISLPERHERARALFEQERYEEARACLECGSALPPEARMLLAAILTNMGALADAERLLDTLLVEDAASAGAHYLMALCREQAGDPDGAERHDEAAVRLAPDFAMPCLHLGLLASRGGRRDRARAHLERAYQLMPDEAPARVQLFGGGFGREALAQLCLSELGRCREGESA